MADLKDQNIPVQRVHQLMKSVATEKFPLPIFFIDVDRIEEGRKVFKIPEILNIKIQVDSFHKVTSAPSHPPTLNQHPSPTPIKKIQASSSPSAPSNCQAQQPPSTNPLPPRKAWSSFPEPDTTIIYSAS
ncbi:hypothetical protein JTE90_028991 [Oedothorax gibbosus]|uniref:Pre-C2HC domain-containing protein n=1 Tax=Oedothorax gibbosus TaxID=931172 RepID=A0AAV6VK37_9ARAC|nr:hypothetical protein JTE90_028991 [Oedothorax gibbosus]